ncbi:pyoverdine dityrosine biosynthesis protein [Diplodia corticola]|uniref:Pyoverdine dityrosine biosynthesis protein n=1 Tax=Diplodia corticola TaxID=236234 RepID=A0A1J9R4S9_9PEZI|nr:pyoverdine dityrosine biosynthesis protein [Diplodia corticola]OJD35577.1 pyoverdine dityrosine biosynthesis protein [Diplodia corticola]
MSVHTVAASKHSTAQVSEDILTVIESYRLKASPFDPKTIPQARDTFLPIILKAVEKRTPVSLTLPAFPFKSPNTEDKVLGTLPDKAEEVALKHLQGLCENIKDTYPPGAELTIVSDGIVYSDLLDVPDSTVWEYGECLRQMAAELDCDAIHFARLSTMPSLKGRLREELLDYTDTAGYEKAAPAIREQLMAVYGEKGYDVNKHIASDPSVKATYMGYLKYLSRDLRKSSSSNGDASGEQSDSSGVSITSTGSSDSNASTGSRKAFKRKVSRVAKQMIARGKCYAACVQAAFPDSVRLSIHAANSATKVPIAIMPNVQDRPITPWHAVMTCRLDGSFIPLTRREAADAADLLELIHTTPTTGPDGAAPRPWCFREKSPLYALPAATSIEHTYPTGLLVRYPPGTPFAAGADMLKVRGLAERNSPVVLRGLAGTTERAAFLAKGREMGPITTWKFGELLEVRDGGGSGGGGLNNVLSAEPMPFHYDGLFKLVNGVSAPPRFQMFVAACTPPPASPEGDRAPGGPGGRTLFATSPLVFERLAAAGDGFGDVDALRAKRWSVTTDAFDHSEFGGLPLVVDHPATGVACLRYHEDWPQERTSFAPTRVRVQGVGAGEDAAIRTAVERALFDRRACLYQGWERGDVLVSDNVLAMHTREGYTSGAARELWRLHID